MFRIFKGVIAAATIAVSSISAFADDGTLPNDSKLWFADKYATAYYSIDNLNGEVTAIILPGPAGGNAVKMRRKLKFNDIQAFTIGGYDDRISVTLLVKQTGQEIVSRVITADDRPDASSRYLD